MAAPSTSIQSKTMALCTPAISLIPTATLWERCGWTCPRSLRRIRRWRNRLQDGHPVPPEQLRVHRRRCAHILSWQDSYGHGLGQTHDQCLHACRRVAVKEARGLTVHARSMAGHAGGHDEVTLPRCPDLVADQEGNLAVQHVP